MNDDQEELMIDDFEEFLPEGLKPEVINLVGVLLKMALGIDPSFQAKSRQAKSALVMAIYALACTILENVTEEDIQNKRLPLDAIPKAIECCEELLGDGDAESDFISLREMRFNGSNNPIYVWQVLPVLLSYSMFPDWMKYYFLSVSNKLNVLKGNVEEDSTLEGYKFFRRVVDAFGFKGAFKLPVIDDGWSLADLEAKFADAGEPVYVWLALHRESYKPEAYLWVCKYLSDTAKAVYAFHKENEGKQVEQAEQYMFLKRYSEALGFHKKDQFSVDAEWNDSLDTTLYLKAEQERVRKEGRSLRGVNAIESTVKDLGKTKSVIWRSVRKMKGEI